MGFLDFLFGANLTAMDESSIARGVQMGVSCAEYSRLRSRQRQIEEVETHNRDIAPTISAARKYEKSFLLVNNEINRSFGYLRFNPMMAPNQMNDEQRQRAFDTIADLTASGKIPITHADRLKKYLNDMLGNKPSTE